VPGVLTRPAISLNAIPGTATSAARADADALLRGYFPWLRDLNVTRGVENCNQAVVAVDRMLAGRDAVRIPPTGPGYAGLDLLQDDYAGEYLTVYSYDDVVDRMSDGPRWLGVMLLGWADGRSHVVNVVQVSDVGVVFLDGQSRDLAELATDATRIGLLRYRHPVPVAPAVVEVVPAADRTERAYVRSMRDHLTRSVVDVPALLALTRRHATAPSARSFSLRESFGRVTGDVLDEAVDEAVAAGRLTRITADHLLGLAGLSGPSAAREPVVERTLSLPYEHAEQRARTLAGELATAGQVDAVLTTLRALGRDVAAVANVRRAWRGLHPGSHLDDALRERWPGHADVFRDLLGHADAAAVPREQVEEWYRRLPLTTFEHAVHGPVRVAETHPEDGCSLRAHHWGAQLRRWGTEPRVVYASGGDRDSLTVISPNARGRQPGVPASVSWRYHTAPVVEMARSVGGSEPMVLDPALGRGPLTVDDWADAISVPRTHRRETASAAALHEMFARENRADPTAWTRDGFSRRPMVLVTNGFAPSMPDPEVEPLTSWDEASHVVRALDDRLYRHHVRMERRQLAQGLWKELQDYARTAPLERSPDYLLMRLQTRVGAATRELTGFLEGNPEVAARARALLEPGHLEQFVSLFAPQPEGELPIDDNSARRRAWAVALRAERQAEDRRRRDVSTVAAPREGASFFDDPSDEESQAESPAPRWSSSAAWTAFGPDPTSDTAAPVRTFPAAEELVAELSGLAPAARVESSRFDPSTAGRTTAGTLDGDQQVVRFDARRFQLPGGDWVSQATVRLVLRPGRGVSDTDVRRLADQVTGAVRDRVNGPGLRLPGGDLFHLDLRVLTAGEGAVHHGVALHAGPGRTSTTDWYLVSPHGVPLTPQQVVHEVGHFIGLPDRYADPQRLFRRTPVSSAVRTAGSVMAAPVAEGALFGPEDLAVIEQVFRSGPVIRDSPYPLAVVRRTTGRPHVVTDVDGIEWSSGSRSAIDSQGRLIPDDERACVQAAVVRVG